MLQPLPDSVRLRTQLSWPATQSAILFPRLSAPTLSLDLMRGQSGNVHAKQECAMSENVADEISRLPALSRTGLLSLWRELFGQPAHPKLRRDLIVPILAYKLQEKAYGGLKPSTRRRLREIAEGLERDRHAHVHSKPSIKAGTKLLRQWQDQTHEVLVTREGFEYAGRQYRSLSQIARKITGTRWSGPAFFGLKQLPNKRPNS